MNTTQSAGRWITSIRDVSAAASMAGFLLAWPLVTLYIAVAWVLVDATCRATGDAAERLYFLGAIMLYVYPLVLLLKIGVSYVAIGMAAISLRPLPMLIAVVTWLSLNGHLPSGIVPWAELRDWTNPVLYSALTILAAFLSWMRAFTKQVSSPNAPSQRFRAICSYRTREDKNGSGT